ncbi:hypothetical protein MJO28_011644 [Puccinia striiformis f. sp. tritici]|uniref:Uncharacterized protein n=1 Tax=Puccinia striiformis f. sp. tritici TaxID=168172 RepID=A0ACC0E400_9BASI|nr:hypothetical protein MJO28_011644 [Puccinia striiformis f. sp. tritici]
MPGQQSSLPEQRPSHDIAATRRDELKPGETYMSQAEDVNYSAGWTNGEFDGTTQIPFELAPERKLNLKIGMPILLTEHIIGKIWFFVTHGDLSSTDFLRLQYPNLEAYAITFHFNLYEPFKISGVFLERRVFQEFVRSLRPVDMVLCKKMFIVSLSQSVMMMKD